MATERPLGWFQKNAIATVPLYYPGAGRKVYPGFLQLAGFMTMNLGSHLVSHWEMFKHLVEGDDESAVATQKFYDEYRSVADMTAEFYLQTVDVVFQRHLLPKGELMHRGHKVDPKAIKDTALLAIEGERDDISGIGQTQRGARHFDAAWRRRRSNISSPRTSVTTASSTAASGARRSRRSSRTGSPRTPDVRLRAS